MRPPKNHLFWAAEKSWNQHEKYCVFRLFFRKMSHFWKTPDFEKFCRHFFSSACAASRRSGRNTPIPTRSPPYNKRFPCMYLGIRARFSGNLANSTVLWAFIYSPAEGQRRGVARYVKSKKNCSTKQMGVPKKWGSPQKKASTGTSTDPVCAVSACQRAELHSPLERSCFFIFTRKFSFWPTVQETKMKSSGAVLRRIGLC